jgi:FixJ family two-component response regulator
MRAREANGMQETSPPAPGEPTVFVVDDDSSLRRGLGRLLRSAGWNVETFASAREYLERPAYAGAGCVIVDVRMPEMTGPELQAQMAARGISLPVVFLTGYCDLAIGVRAMKMGALDFLVKPVDDVTLLQAVRQGLERHAADQASKRQRKHINDRLLRVSPREREVLQWVIAGHPNKQIADRMAITLKTVKVHRAHVMEKMQVRSVAELVHLCETVGMGMAQGMAQRSWDQGPVVPLNTAT